MNKQHIIYRMAQTIAELQDEIHHLNMRLEFADPETASELAMVKLRSRLQDTQTDASTAAIPLSDFLKTQPR